MTLVFWKGTHLLRTRARKLCFKSNFERRILFGFLWRAPCWHHGQFSSAENQCSSRKNNGRCLSALSLQSPITDNSIGFLSLYGGLSKLSWTSAADRLNLQQLFSGSTERKEDGIESLKKHYKKYKENYVKKNEVWPSKAQPKLVLPL